MAGPPLGTAPRMAAWSPLPTVVRGLLELRFGSRTASTVSVLFSVVSMTPDTAWSTLDGTIYPRS